MHDPPLCYALSKIQDFFENSNSYVIYLCWHVIAKHQLISSSMNMLANGVGSRSGARGIPSAITARSEEDDRSMTSKTISSVSTTGQKENDNGDSLCRSIREHASRLQAFAKAKTESTRHQLEHDKQKQKRKRYDKIQLEIGRLRAEKRQLTIQMFSIAPSPQQANLENALSMSIAEVDEDIDKYSKQLSKVDVRTPQKSNRSPDF